MNDKTQLIVEAAKVRFMRYGFAKTTMSDIATEAGVARQTLYNAFPGKEEILRVVVRQYSEQNLETIKTAWQSDKRRRRKVRDLSSPWTKNLV